MCLLVFAWKTHPDYPLIFAGNRDELHARPANAAGFWEDAPQVLAGRDSQAGGTWLGVTTGGRFAVVTNYREGLHPPKAPRSRGELAAGFLCGDMPSDAYINAVVERLGDYGAFSLLVGDHTALWYFSNRGEPEPREVPPGIHGLSNHLLDTPWPKVTRSTARLEALLAHAGPASEPLFNLLADRIPAEADTLPDTGIGPEFERLSSAPFVVHPVYGTRCSSVIFLHRGGGIHFAERRFDPAGTRLETRHFYIANDLS